MFCVYSDNLTKAVTPLTADKRTRKQIKFYVHVHAMHSIHKSEGIHKSESDLTGHHMHCFF